MSENTFSFHDQFNPLGLPNGAIPWGLKNALDWVSQVSSQNPDILKHKCVAVQGASSCIFSTVSAQHHGLPVMQALGMQHGSGGRLLVSRAQEVFQGGNLQ
jgi:NAD(P)H-dependent FMN reductase